MGAKPGVVGGGCCWYDCAPAWAWAIMACWEAEKPGDLSGAKPGDMGRGALMAASWKLWCWLFLRSRDEYWGTGSKSGVEFWGGGGGGMLPLLSGEVVCCGGGGG